MLSAAERFSVSSKVGYFPSPAGTEHLLSPGRLTEAAEQTAELLGRAPDVLFLHNPETSLSTKPSRAAQQLTAACAAMHEIVEAGLARTWGIVCWDASRLQEVVSTVEHRPAVVMVRVGLSIPAAVLRASGDLIERLGFERASCWGMSPLGGTHAQQVIDAADYTTFIADDCANPQAALRLAFELPPVSTVCLSTTSPDHLRQAVDALALQPKDEHLARYRSLLCR